MAGKLEFKEKLGGILTLSQNQNQSITLEEIEKYFEEDNLSREQTDLVCDYLLSQEIAVKGYVRHSGVIKEAEETQEELSREEQEYINDYLREIAGMDERNESDAKLAYYLPKVADAALRMHRSGLFLGDVIQEGNISLLLALEKINNNSEEQVMESVRLGMMAFIEAQTETSRQDKQMVNRVSELDEAIKQMSKEYGRKVSVDELAEYTAIKEEEIVEIMKLAGEEIVKEQEEGEVP